MTGADHINDPYAARPWVAFYPPRVAPELPDDYPKTLTAIFHTAVETYPDRAALSSFGVERSYREVDAAARAVAAWLQAWGLKKGDRVAIMAPNVMTYPVTIFGVLLAGGVVVNVNPLYTPNELEHQIVDSGARLLFVLENFAHTVRNAWPHMKLEGVVVMTPGDLLGWKGALINFVSRHVKHAVPPYRLPDPIPFSRVVREGAAAPFEAVEVAPDDIAFLQYTGGTTGVAKGATLLHRNVAANVAQSVAWLYPFVGDAPQVMVTALPLYHIFGLTACCLMLTRIGGCCLLIANPRDIKGFVKTLRESRFTMMSGVNTLYAAMMDDPDFDKTDFSTLIFSIAGGMATQDATARRWKAITGKPIIEGYGLSETSPIVTCNRADLEEFSGTIGYPQPSTDISIRLPDDGTPAPFGERGELCVKGPQVMAGYWNRPDETAKSMTSDGYFRTGDIAILLPDGQVKIVDRLKDMILVSGFNVYPNEVENVLTQHPKVKEAAVVGAPDPHSGETPMAFIVARDPSLTREELKAFAHESLTSYKVPKFWEFRSELPKTNVGKILRRSLRDEVLAREKTVGDEGRGKSVKTEAGQAD